MNRAARAYPDRLPAADVIPSPGYAHATLRRGAAFLSATAMRTTGPAAWPAGRQSAIRARYLGNCLRELDRFLGALLDERRVAPPTRLLTLRPTTAARLADYAGDDWDLDRAQRRLHALGRARSCMFHHGGHVREGDAPQGRWLTAGWYAAGRSPHLRRYPLGALLRPDAADLADIAAFYLALGDRIARGPAKR